MFLLQARRVYSILTLSFALFRLLVSCALSKHLPRQSPFALCTLPCMFYLLKRQRHQPANIDANRPLEPKPMQTANRLANCISLWAINVLCESKYSPMRCEKWKSFFLLSSFLTVFVLVALYFFLLHFISIHFKWNFLGSVCFANISSLNSKPYSFQISQNIYSLLWILTKYEHFDFDWFLSAFEVHRPIEVSVFLSFLSNIT